MSDDIVVVDNGQTYETSESAIVAKNEADRAEQWAKYSEEKANLASDSATSAATSRDAAASSAQSAANTVNRFDAHAAEKQSAFDTNAAQKTQAFNDNAQSKTNTFNTNAAQKQAAVDASAENARKWAVGDLSERPEGSAKHWAEEAKSYAETTSSTGLYNRLSNCILEIPQNIKLALNNNVITLKAGSKLYKPNGKGNFSEIAISSDINFSAQNFATAPHNLVLLPNGTLQALKLDQTFSGQTAPIPSTKYAFWYDTVNNLIKYTFDTGATWQSGCSFPLVVINIVNGIGITSYEPPFNGFGFIGSCLFALPGVKLLMPNGRNSDGSLNNFEYTTLNPAVSEGIPGNNDYFLGFTSGGGFKRNQVFSGFYVSDSFISTSSQWCLLFNTTDNFYYSTVDYGATWNKYTLLAQIGIFTGNNGKISRLNVRQPFRAANDQESVHKIGNEEIFGRKTFTGAGVGIIKSGSAIDIQNPNVDLSNTDGSVSGTTEIHFIDKNGIIQGITEHQNRTSGESVMILAARNHANNSWTTIECGFDAKDKAFSKAPTPPATSNSTDIATTSWVRQTDGALGLPNLTASVTLSKDTSYTTPQKGWLYFRGSCALGSDLAVDVAISGVKYEKYIYLYQLGSVTNAVAQWVPIDKGATILAHGGGNLQEFLFYPSK